LTVPAGDASAFIVLGAARLGTTRLIDNVDAP
jgi:pantothenate synthetase